MPSPEAQQQQQRQQRKSLPNEAAQHPEPRQKGDGGERRFKQREKRPASEDRQDGGEQHLGRPQRSRKIPKKFPDFTQGQALDAAPVCREIPVTFTRSPQKRSPQKR